MQYQPLPNDGAHEEGRGEQYNKNVASHFSPTHVAGTSLHLSSNSMSDPSNTREYSVSSLNSSRGSDNPLHPRDGRYKPEHMQSNSPLLASGDIHDARGVETIDNRSSRIRQDGHEPPSSKQTSPSATWMPYTLRWWYMCLVLAATSALLATIAALLAKSRAESGIAADDNSSSLLWGWRYTPTLCAVIYSQLITMLFDDIRRTEAFALMARPKGGSARSTLLQRSGAWWTVLRNALKKKNGKRSWALFSACVVNVLAFLAISPLSSSLLTSLDVQIHRDTEFSSIVPPKNGASIALRPQGDTFFRTISNLLQNVTTSAFIADPYLVFPSHPSTIRQAPLGARLSDNASTWHTRSLVYQLEYDCVSAQVSSKNDTPYSLRLETPSCPYQINMSLLVSDDFLARGGSVWTNLNYTASSNDTKSTKSDCDQNVDIIIMTTSWMYQGLKEPRRLESNGTLKAHVCNTKVYQDLSTVVVTNSPTMSRVDINQTSFKSQREEVQKTTLNMKYLRHLLVDSRWSNYLSEPLRDAGSSFSSVNKLPVYQGAAAALGAFYNWNFTMMLEAPDIVSRSRQVQQRLFGELLQVSVMQPDASEIVAHSGTIVEIERRIVVVPQVAITLIALLGLSIVLMSVVFFMSRLFKRPLYLTQDPATVIGLADRLPLIDPSPNLHNLSLASKKDIESRLHHDTYQISPERSSAATFDDHEQTHKPSALHSQWKPTSLRLWNLVLVLLYIIAILVTVSVLYHFAVRHKLYKTAFVYRATIHMLQSAKFAPYSILPTLLAVGVELVWDSIESTIRRLQPYLSMTKKPTPIKDGSGLSYQSSYLAWSALKALKHKHWLLAMISTGSVVCKILVVAMSALFERENGVMTHSLVVPRLVEPRQIPYVSQDSYNRVLGYGDGQESAVPGRIIRNMFTNAQTNWMYSATIQLTLGGVEPAWSKDGWSFLPAPLRDLPISFNASHVQNLGDSTSDESQPFSTTNFTFSTTATRARLECGDIPQVQNISSWLSQTRFQLLPNSTRGRENPVRTGYEVTRNMFHQDYTSLLTHPGLPSCCLDASKANETQSLTIGYWSSTGDMQYWPNTDTQWPMNMTIKFLRSNATRWPSGVKFLENSTIGFPISHSGYMFTEVPRLQAMNCRPRIETAPAVVTVDYTTGAVQHFTIGGEPQPDNAPWSDPFVTRNQSYANDPRKNDMIVNVETSTSYGISFLTALLGASDLEQIRGATRKTVGGGGAGGGQQRPNDTSKHGLDWTIFEDESTGKDETFRIRDNSSGLNLDLMSYAMYNLANKDPDALLNATTMLELAQKVFQTYFQHFVSTNTEPNATFGAYQPLDAKINPVLLNMSQMYQKQEWQPSTSYRRLNTNRTINGTVTTRIELLHMNPVATWITVASLAWLLCTIVALLALQKRYLGPLIRDIESIADVLVLIVGSDSLKKLVEENDTKSLVKNKDICTKLGWFTGRDGQVRWGIEVVGDVGLGAVEWLDGPAGVVWDGGEKQRKASGKSWTNMLRWLPFRSGAKTGSEKP